MVAGSPVLSDTARETDAANEPQWIGVPGCASKPDLLNGSTELTKRMDAYRWSALARKQRLAVDSGNPAA